MWGQIPHEKQIQATIPSIRSPQDYQQVIQSKLGLHLVQIINNEVIAAGAYATNQAVTLAHCKVGENGQLLFTFKS